MDDITVYAVYTAIIVPNPTENAVINVKSGEIYKNSNVTVIATASNVPEGYFVAIFDGNKEKSRGDNKSVSYNAGEISSDKTLTAKIVDAAGNVQKDATGNDLSKNIEIKVKTGFFDRIIAFIKKLFRSNKVIIEP